jgi:membrane protein implicated in regulation of membrane protease activity
MSAATAVTNKTANHSLLRWIFGGALFAMLATVVAIAVWPASEADKARADGERVGQAVGDLYYAENSAEAEYALTELSDAVADTRDHAGDRVANQVAGQEDALARAADGFVGSHTSDDAWDVELYQAELDVALDDLTSQASDFRAEGPEVNQAFWEGFEDGLPSD